MAVAWRAPGAADLGALLALVNAIESADGDPWKTTAEQLAHDLGRVTDPAQDVVAGFAPDGRAVALAWIPAGRGGARKHRALLMPYVHPDHRAAVGDELLNRIEARAAAILRALPDGLPRVIRSWAPAGNAALRDLHERHGFAAQRYFSERRRPTGAPLPEAPLPDGVTVVPWRDELSEAVRAVHNEAFADHWGSEPMDAETWDHYHLSGPDARPDLSLLATTPAGIVGYLLTDVYPEDAQVTGVTEAFVATLGVRREWRRRGIASALLVLAVAAYRHAGFEYAALGVDAASETGALGLYDRLGFVEFHRTVSYVKEVRA